jgi:hypothetical protein
MADAISRSAWIGSRQGSAMHHRRRGSPRAGRDDVAGRFCARSRALHDQRACRLEPLSRTGSPGRRPRLSRDWAPALAQCPITHATLAICGDRVRRGGCLDRALRLASASGSASSSFVTRERSVGQAAAWRRRPWRGAVATPRWRRGSAPEGQARAFRRWLDDCFRRASPPRFRMRRIYRGLIRSFRRFARQRM